MTQADRIIGKFGGINSMARALGHKNASTVQGWRDRGMVPSKRHQEIWDASKRLNIELRLSDFAAISDAPPNPIGAESRLRQA